MSVPLDLRGLQHLALLRRLTRLELHPLSSLTSADLGPLAALGQLQHLELFLVRGRVWVTGMCGLRACVGKGVKGKRLRIKGKRRC